MSNSKKIEEFDLLEIQTLNGLALIAQSKLEYFTDYLKRKYKLPDDAKLDINTGEIKLPEKKDA